MLRNVRARDASIYSGDPRYHSFTRRWHHIWAVFSLSSFSYIPQPPNRFDSLCRGAHRTDLRSDHIYVWQLASHRAPLPES